MSAKPQWHPQPYSPRHLGEQIVCSIGQRSSAGIKPQNEDSIGIRIPDGSLQATKGIAAVIADGVSAAEAGKEASEIAVQGFLSDYYSTPDVWTIKKSAQQVLTALNRWLYSLGKGVLAEERGYLCTFSSLVFKSRTAHLFHAGDSRIYRYRDGLLEQLTEDHCRRLNDHESFLARALGLGVNLDIDYRQLPTEPDDLYLLTTDGIHDFVSSREIRQILDSQSCPEAICNTLIQQAQSNQSDDNLSCQVVRLDSLPGQNISETQQQLTTLPFPPDLEPGMSLDGYRVIRTLHASNRSQLYAVEAADGQRYCMKTPSANYDDDPAYIERFTLESWIGQRVQNSHVVKIVNPEQPPRFLYYLTEYVDGITLSQWIKENPKPSITEVVYLVEQIGKALRAFHRREIFHQDIKPDNILINKDGVVKIIDFGSCYSAAISEIATPIERDIVLGTANYSAPEQVLMGKITPAADIFSLAVVAYEMLTGAQPFNGKLEHCRSSQDYLRTRYTRAYTHNPLVPEWMDGALRKSLRFQPERRYQDVDEFIYDLKQPNPKLVRPEDRALIQRSPLLFWQALSAILGVIMVILVMLLAN